MLSDVEFVVVVVVVIVVGPSQYAFHKHTTVFRHTLNGSGSIFLVGQGVDNRTHGVTVYIEE